jgi:predicted ATP-grasp superfamily ATP-dependent carboligase
VPDFTRHPKRLASALREIEAEHGAAPVVFPTADPDLQALLEVLPGLGERIRPALAAPDLVAQLVDKARFDELARQQDLPVPRTLRIERMAQIEDIIAGEIAFPMIVKPTQPVAWQHPGVEPAVARAKAVVVETPERLREIARMLAPHGFHIIAQDYVPGGDSEHFTVDVYIGPDGAVRASSCGRKLRHDPPHIGSGSYCENLRLPELEMLAAEVLTRIGYRGVANLDFKRHELTGEYKLLEINPRVSQWGILTTRCGVNLPWLAWRDAQGLPAPDPAPPVRAGRWYVNGLKDLRAVRQYRAEGLTRWSDYLRSLLRWPLVCQTLSLDDPRPALVLTSRWIARKMKASRQSPRRRPAEDPQTPRHP